MFIFSDMNFLFFPDALLCVVIRFDRPDVNSDGNLVIVGVPCSDTLDKNIVCEIHEGNEKLWKIEYPKSNAICFSCVLWNFKQQSIKRMQECYGISIEYF